MWTRSLARTARQVMPSPVFDWTRRIGSAILTPIFFSHRSGHFRSCLRQVPLDCHGAPLPWYTYPTIHFLETKDLRDKTVLEFGAGYSTLWWASHVKSVVAFEDNRGWYDRLLAKVPPNVKLVYVEDSKPELLGAFDIIIVDGLERGHCIKLASRLLALNGAIVADDSEGYGWNGHSSIVGPLCDDGFSRIDFYGYAPGVSLPRCTSVLFRCSTFLLSDLGDPRRLVF